MSPEEHIIERIRSVLTMSGVPHKVTRVLLAEVAVLLDELKRRHREELDQARQTLVQ
jgi:hypothetical protein